MDEGLVQSDKKEIVIYKNEQRRIKLQRLD
jgi:hypothetical protein